MVVVDGQEELDVRDWAVARKRDHPWESVMGNAVFGGVLGMIVGYMGGIVGGTIRWQSKC